MRVSKESRSPADDEERLLSLRIRLSDNDSVSEVLHMTSGFLKPNAALMASAVLANFRADPQADLRLPGGRLTRILAAEAQCFIDGLPEQQLRQG